MRHQQRNNTRSGSTDLGEILTIFAVVAMIAVVIKGVVQSCTSSGNAKQPKPVPGSYASQNRPPSVPSRLRPSEWDGSVPAVKEWISENVRDPGSVKYHSWDNQLLEGGVTSTVDFTAVNGFGGPSRDTWQFIFSRRSGDLLRVTSKRSGDVYFTVPIEDFERGLNVQ